MDGNRRGQGQRRPAQAGGGEDGPKRGKMRVGTLAAVVARLGSGLQLSARQRLRQKLGVDLSLAVEAVHILLVAAACLVGLAVTFRRFFFR